MTTGVGSRDNRQVNREDTKRPITGLHQPLAEIDKAKTAMVADLLTNHRRDGDATRWGQSLQPRGDVHPATVDVAVGFIDDVAEVDTDPEANALRLRHGGLSLGHAALDCDRARDRVHHARELAERAVAHELHDTATVLSDERLDELLAVNLEALERAGLVALHQARVADHVGRQDSGEPALRTGSSHGRTLRDRLGEQPAILPRGIGRSVGTAHERGPCYWLKQTCPFVTGNGKLPRTQLGRAKRLAQALTFENLPWRVPRAALLDRTTSIPRSRASQLAVILGHPSSKRRVRRRRTGKGSLLTF